MTLTAAINGVFFLLVLMALSRIVNSKTNDLEWWHLVASKGIDGKNYMDWNKIGRGGGVMLSMWIPFIYVNTDKMDGLGLAAVVSASLAYLGGVDAYSKALRAKQEAK